MSMVEPTITNIINLIEYFASTNHIEQTVKAYFHFPQRIPMTLIKDSDKSNEEIPLFQAKNFPWDLSRNHNRN